MASMLRSNRFMVSMSSYAFQLLISYLQEQKFILFLKIINQYIKIRSTLSELLFLVTATGPSLPYSVLGFESEPKLELTSRSTIDWGVHHVDPRIESEVYRRLRSDFQKSSSIHKVLSFILTFSHRNKSTHPFNLTVSCF